MRNSHSELRLPEIVQVASNLTTMRIGNYIELEIEPKTLGTRFIGEGMNLSGIPTFDGGGIPSSWKLLPVAGASHVYSVTPISMAPGTTVGMSISEYGNPLLFVTEVLGHARMTATMVGRLMTQAKQCVLHSNRSWRWMEAIFGRLAPKVYNEINYGDYGGTLDHLLDLRRDRHRHRVSALEQSNADIYREMVVHAIATLHGDILGRRRILGPRCRLEYALIREIRRVRAEKQIPARLVNFLGNFDELDQEDEIEAADTEILSMARTALSEDTFEHHVADNDLLRTFCARLEDLERRIVRDRFEDPRITNTALARRYNVSRQWIWLTRRAIEAKAEVLGIRGMI